MVEFITSYIHGMLDGARIVNQDETPVYGERRLRFYCKVLLENLGDKPAECEHLWLVKRELTAHPFMTPKVYSILEDSLPDMVDVLKEAALALVNIDLGRKLVKERGLEGKYVFSWRWEGDRFSITDYSVSKDRRLTITQARTICDSRSSLMENDVYTLDESFTNLTRFEMMSRLLNPSRHPDMQPPASEVSN